MPDPIRMLIRTPSPPSASGHPAAAIRRPIPRPPSPPPQGGSALRTLRPLLALTWACLVVAAAEPFVLTSPEVADGGDLPRAYTGDGEAATLPLAWSGVPAGTTCFALVMHHLDPEGRTKWYWVLYRIPATIPFLPRNAPGIGILGSNSINHRIGYAPPHSKGPGPKTYVYTLYALSAEPDPQPPAGMPELAAAMAGKIIASADLKVVYTRFQTPSATSATQP